MELCEVHSASAQVCSAFHHVPGAGFSTKGGRLLHLAWLALSLLSPSLFYTPLPTLVLSLAHTVDLRAHTTLYPQWGQLLDTNYLARMDSHPAGFLRNMAGLAQHFSMMHLLPDLF